jgi:hypothetical protein
MDLTTITGLTDATIQGIDFIVNTGAFALGAVLVALAIWARANQPCCSKQEQAYSIWAAVKQ